MFSHMTEGIPSNDHDWFSAFMGVQVNVAAQSSTTGPVVLLVSCDLLHRWYDTHSRTEITLIAGKLPSVLQSQ